jgi:sporulation protein YlmC with PRC-barrel domain
MSKVTDVDIALGILDHQLLDADTANCGKVDDLEISGLNGGTPEVTEILVGGTAWRSRGPLGRLVAQFSRNAVHVPWTEVESVTSVVKLRSTARELGLGRADDRWARIIGWIPGS